MKRSEALRILRSMSTADLLRLYKSEEVDDWTHSQIHEIVQSRKGKDFPVGLASLLQGR